jgi:hypothetical protein
MSRPSDVLCIGVNFEVWCILPMPQAPCPIQYERHIGCLMGRHQVTASSLSLSLRGGAGQLEPSALGISRDPESWGSRIPPGGGRLTLLKLGLLYGDNLLYVGVV